MDVLVRSEALFALAALLMLACPAAAKTKGPLVVEPDGKPGPSVAFWLKSSLARVYPASEPGSGKPLDLIAARNGRISFQACLRNNRVSPLAVECSVEGADGLQVQVRRVGFVPLPHFTTETDKPDLEGLGHVPGPIPDPLFPEGKATVGPWETGAFWITIAVPADAKPGPRDLKVHFSFLEGKQHADLNTKLDVSSFVIKPRHDFPVTHWWREECIWDFYKTGMFEDEKLWAITKPFIKDMVDHGSDTIYIPLFFMRRETFTRPAQLLKVTEPEPGKYVFDFSDVSRFVKLAKDCGAQHYEWSHLWIYWGVVNPVPVYTWKNGKAVMLWPIDTDGHGPIYHNFLRQFLPEFHDFLVKEGILDKSFFHLSDEPGGQHIENYKKARQFLRETAPWMKVMDALSDVEYGKQHLTDMPIPLITTAPQFLSAKIPHWVYFCCAPHGAYLNRFYDTPLVKVRMSGWLFYKMKANGFLHWGYNYWHALEQEKLLDPFTDGSCADWPLIPYGDGHMVYPGPNGPIDSIRWEVFAESLQDYAILQTAGINPDDPMLGDIKDYAVFPRSEKWIGERLKEILKQGEQ
jgi:hypothetical protein